MTEQEIVLAVTKHFRCFGGGRTSEFNPLTNALANKAPMFAAGVDVAEVVRFILESAPLKSAVEAGIARAVVELDTAKHNAAHWRTIAGALEQKLEVAEMHIRDLERASKKQKTIPAPESDFAWTEGDDGVAKRVHISELRLQLADDETSEE